MQTWEGSTHQPDGSTPPLQLISAQLTTVLVVQILMHVREAWPAMPYTCLYSVHHYWWKRQVSYQRWIGGIRCAQARKHVSDIIHPGFETQGRCHQKSKTGVSVAPQKGLVSYKLKKKIRQTDTCENSTKNGKLHLFRRTRLSPLVTRPTK